jgi:hypothetical protein
MEPHLLWSGQGILNRLLDKSMNKPSRLRKKIAALIQAAALLFLQLYSIPPLSGHFVAPVRHGLVCSGDHQICGCPLERILNRTCCCFRSADLIQSLMDHRKDPSKPVSKADLNGLARFIGPPCGSHQDLSFTSPENIIFLRAAAMPEGPDFLFALNAPKSGDPFRTRSSEPPDPPPKSIAS